MNATLLKSLLALAPTSALLVTAVIVFIRARSIGSFLQLLGAACLVIVVLTHLFEALGLLPWMGWGQQHSVGHYVDLWSAVFGLTLLPAGYVLRRLRRPRLTRA